MKNIDVIGMKELQAAVKRNPKKVLGEAKRFITRGLAAYHRGIIRNPWRVGSMGGGAPVDTGNLRDTHMSLVRGLVGIVGPNTKMAKYARSVHQGKGRMKARPWLDYVKKNKDKEIQGLYGKMLTNITKDLAR